MDDEPGQIQVNVECHTRERRQHDDFPGHGRLCGATFPRVGRK